MLCIEGKHRGLGKRKKLKMMTRKKFEFFLYIFQNFFQFYFNPNTCPCFYDFNSNFSLELDPRLELSFPGDDSEASKTPYWRNTHRRCHGVRVGGRVVKEGGAPMISWRASDKEIQW